MLFGLGSFGRARRQELGFGHPATVSAISLKENKSLIFSFLESGATTDNHARESDGQRKPLPSLMNSRPWTRLQLHAPGQGAVDHEVRSGRKTRGGTGEKDDAAANLLRFRHPPGRVQRHRVLKEVGQVRFDVLPDAAVEISVARRNRIHPDHFRRVLIGEVSARNE